MPGGALLAASLAIALAIALAVALTTALAMALAVALSVAVFDSLVAKERVEECRVAFGGISLLPYAHSFLFD